MITRFSGAASALSLACALAAPAMAQGPDSMTEVAAATVLATAAAVPAADSSAEDDIAGFELGAAAAPDAVTITAGAATPGGLAPANGEIVVTSAVVAAAVQGASTPAPRDERFSVVLNQDAFFGFYPTFNGLIPVGENVDFSFYGILWTTPSFASTALAGAGPSGNDLWTEFGIGANFILADGALQVKPQIGITNGALLSGGVLDANDVPTGTGSNFGDGIVPSLTINYSDPSFEAEFYGGYYAALANRNKDAALDFLHT